MLNGDIDLQTPLENAERAKQDWPNSILVTIKDAPTSPFGGASARCALP